MADDLDAILAERGARYGKFTRHAMITQALKAVMKGDAICASSETPNADMCTVIDALAKKWVSLASDQKESLEMIAHKIGRILNGDPNYSDSWHDIAGYAKLVGDRLDGKSV